MLPRAVGLVGVLVGERRDGQGGRGVGFRGVGFERVGLFEVGAGAGFNGEGVGPLAVDGVEDFFFAARGVERCEEGVLFAGQPAFAAVVDFGDVAG